MIKKPFLSIAADIDDSAIERMALAKGVPQLSQTVANRSQAMAAMSEPSRAGQGAQIVPAAEPEVETPTPRARISYVKAGIPDYALLELKTRAMHEKVSLNHIILSALKTAGFDIHDRDLIEDGRRLRGSRRGE